jgi:peptidoglycan/LPS O-acetylase OafA/YrhL
VLTVPRIGGAAAGNFWMNGLYESLIIVVIFPVIVFLGASGNTKGSRLEDVCRFLGNISYPVYIIHYPLIYIFSAWVVDKQKTIAEGWPYGLLILVGAVTLAYFFLKVYDLPVRQWLTKKWLPGRKVTAQV